MSKRRVSFHYASVNSHPATVEPYKIVHYDGFWYLVAREDGTGIIKRYAMDKLKELKMLSESFPAVPANLDELLRQSANIWFCEERNLEVVIEVNKKAADDFKRRKIFPTQEIREEKPDGTLIVNFRVGHFGEIRETLKTWLPNIRITGPESMKKHLLTNFVIGFVGKKQLSIISPAPPLPNPREGLPRLVKNDRKINIIVEMQREKGGHLVERGGKRCLAGGGSPPSTWKRDTPTKTAVSGRNVRKSSPGWNSRVSRRSSNG